MATDVLTQRDSKTGAGVGLQVNVNPDGSALPIYSTVQKKWRTDFSNPAALADKWDITGTGAMTYNGLLGTLTVNMGTNLDDDLTFVTKEDFSIPLRVMVAPQISQRIMNQTVFLELVSCDPVTKVPDEASVMAWRIDGTNASGMTYDVGTGANPRLMSAIVSTPTVNAPNFAVLELEAFLDEAWFHARAMDSGNARTNSYVRHQQIPSPGGVYKFRMRFRNRQWLGGVTAIVSGTGGVIRITRNAHGLTTGDNVTVDKIDGLTGISFPWTGPITVVDTNSIELNGTAFAGAWINTGWPVISRNAAPASNSVVNMNFVTINDYAELTAEITAGRGNASPGQAMGVQVLNAPNMGSSLGDNGSGNPYSNAVTRAALVTLTTGRVSGGTVTLGGQAINKPYAIPEVDWQFASATGGIVNTTAVQMRAGQAAGYRNYCTGLSLINQNAVPTEVVVLDGASTVLFRTWLGASMTTPQCFTFPTPLRGTAATAMNIACITTGAQVHASAQGYGAP